MEDILKAVVSLLEGALNQEIQNKERCDACIFLRKQVMLPTFKHVTPLLFRLSGIFECFIYYHSSCLLLLNELKRFENASWVNNQKGMLLAFLL